MHISWRDVLATILVVVAVLIWSAWALGTALPWFDVVPAVAVAVLALGVGASLSAVVPGFEELMHGSRSYLVAASVVGVIAFVAGIIAIISAESLALLVLVLSTVALWAMSTMRHSSVAGPQRLSHR